MTSEGKAASPKTFTTAPPTGHQAQEHFSFFPTDSPWLDHSFEEFSLISKITSDLVYRRLSLSSKDPPVSSFQGYFKSLPLHLDLKPCYSFRKLVSFSNVMLRFQALSLNVCQLLNLLRWFVSITF